MGCPRADKSNSDVCRFGLRLRSGTEKVNPIDVKSDNGAVLRRTLHPHIP